MTKTFKKIGWAIVIIAIGYGGYRLYRQSTASSSIPRYVTTTVKRGTITQTVTGTGQISSSNQLDIKTKVSGTIIRLPVTEGALVPEGTVLAEFDAKDAQKAVRDAEVNLESAKIALAKLIQPADALSITQAQDALTRADDSKKNAETDLAKAYDDGLNTVSTVFLDLPGVMTGLQDMLYSSTQGLGAGQWNIDFYASEVDRYNQFAADQYRSDADASLRTIARPSYDAAFADYKATARTASTSTVATLIGETYTATRQIAEAVKNANNLIQLYKDTLTKQGQKPAQIATTHLATLAMYTAQTNTHLANLLATMNTIKTDTDAIANADRTITENSESLAKLKAGVDPLDIQTAQLTVTQRENALLDAKLALSDYTIRAPFAGTIAKIPIKKFDTESSGAVIATLVTQQKIATISLNEIDAAKIQKGEKAAMTFDAVPGLTVTGVVTQIDTVGTVSQGVVTYAAQIALDTQDSRIKPGMSLSASIITNTKNDVLIIPNIAIKTRGDRHAVDVFSPPLAVPVSGKDRPILSSIPPKTTPVAIGIADDTNTEITNGLVEGDQVVVRTINQNSAGSSAATNAQPRPFGGGGGPSGVRFFRGD